MGHYIGAVYCGGQRCRGPSCVSWQRARLLNFLEEDAPSSRSTSHVRPCCRMVGDRVHTAGSRRSLDALRQGPPRGGEMSGGLSCYGPEPDRSQAAGILREKGVDHHSARVEGCCPTGVAPQPD
eukprot:1319475-Pyramimonas_sp.AAC.1